MQTSKEQDIGQEILLSVHGLDSWYGHDLDAIGAKPSSVELPTSQNRSQTKHWIVDPECYIALEHMRRGLWGEAEDILHQAGRRRTTTPSTDSFESQTMRHGTGASDLARPLGGQLSPSNGSRLPEKGDENGDADRDSMEETRNKTLAALESVATQLRLDGRREDAELLRQQTMEIKDRCAREVNPDTTSSLRNLLAVLVLPGDQRDEGGDQIGHAQVDLERQFDETDQGHLEEHTCCS